MLQKAIRALLFLGITYFIIDGLLHIFNIKLISTVNSWPKSALSFATLLDSIYASFIFLAAAFAFMLQRDLKKYKTLVLISGIWALFHSALLIYLTLSQDFFRALLEFPSLHLWQSIYPQIIILDALALFLYGILVLIWSSKK